MVRRDLIARLPSTGSNRSRVARRVGSNASQRVLPDRVGFQSRKAERAAARQSRQLFGSRGDCTP